MLYTTNIYNFDFINENRIIQIELNRIIISYLESELFDMVRIYYQIKLDRFDGLNTNQIVIEDFLIKLLDQLVQFGIIDPKSDIYSNIKQYVHSHMNELISKTLLYIRVILDVTHRWIANYYNSFKTLNELII
jgi:hypothetical protein